MSQNKSSTTNSSKDTKCHSYWCQDKECKLDHTHEHTINKKKVICTEQGCYPCVRCNGYNNSGTSWCIDCEREDNDYIECKHGYSGCNGSSCPKCYF